MDAKSPPLLDEVLATLRAHEGELREQGVKHAAVFGSVARGEGGPDSDVDIMVSLDDQIVVSLLDYAEVAGLIGDLVGRQVDVADRDRLRDHVKPSALRDAVDAF